MSIEINIGGGFGGRIEERLGSCQWGLVEEEETKGVRRAAVDTFIWRVDRAWHARARLLAYSGKFSNTMKWSIVSYWRTRIFGSEVMKWWKAV
jgi:hypothetical protein